ncbi:hypothetical protein A3762_08380 [Oleiphilus sp. HI0125]|uniref:outer membrane beta-barrel protein n=2 Tax=Oleiphilus sp. HI0125 TaxID=1822266 RepID=UPI0007C27DEC|nr:outer membrane beta-barrel protein [Oleiphilus sp. HI0125]KZZ58127.1 hypothetical protein A3762_08380 [Oleiphilus sp. HI0125]
MPTTNTLRVIALLTALFTSVTTFARGPAAPTDPVLDREGRDYLAIGTHFNQFKSILLVLEPVPGSDDSASSIFEFPLTAQTYGASLTYGTHITDNFFTELRYGQGVISDTLSAGALEVNINEWFNWYIGGAYAVTDYATAYAKYGLTFYNADITRYETERFQLGEVPPFGSTDTYLPSTTQMEEELFGDNFSSSWLVGIDFGIYKDIYWSFEYGRLLNDNTSGIKVYQFNSLLKYEF